MAKRPKAPKGGLTPGKGIAIGILTVVLLVTIVSQFGGKKKIVAAQLLTAAAARWRVPSRLVRPHRRALLRCQSDLKQLGQNSISLLSLPATPSCYPMFCSLVVKIRRL